MCHSIIKELILLWRVHLMCHFKCRWNRKWIILHTCSIVVKVPCCHFKKMKKTFKKFFKKRRQIAHNTLAMHLYYRGHCDCSFWDMEISIIILTIAPILFKCPRKLWQCDSEPALTTASNHSFYCYFIMCLLYCDMSNWKRLFSCKLVNKQRYRSNSRLESVAVNELGLK